ncbi:MAG: ABC transporter permease [Planctomycetota bacterium]|nr:ABC transporter permease [Planctomycetota bacterium]
MDTARSDNPPRIIRWPGSGLLGQLLLWGMVAACFLSLPWTMGEVAVQGGSRPRYQASNLQLALLPPSWSGLSVPERELISRESSQGAYVPGLVFGTDRLGRDFFARCLMGGTISLAIGFAAALLSVVIGTLYGAISDWKGGRLDAILMRIVDILFGLPYILLVVLLSVAVDGYMQRQGAQLSGAARQTVNVLTLLIAIGAVSWLAMARVIRGQVLSLRERPFIEAARAGGIPVHRQLARHLLPNLMGPVIVYATLAVPAAILSESFLSFLGIGVQEPLPSWGNLASSGLTELNTVKSRWWLLLWPCLLIGVTLLALNFLGDHLKDRFDPVRSNP